MPRSKIQMSLIGDAGDRARTFARRKAGLLKKAQDLAKLCDVDIALVVCPGGAGAPPAVWESDPGAVIDRYRNLPADKREQHTHLGYIDGQLSKEEGRLDKKRRQGLNRALACPGEAELEGMDLEALLASIDAALLATDERRKALGVANDGDGGGKQLGQAVSSSSDAAVVPVVDGQGCSAPLVVGGGDELDDDIIQAWVDELMRDLDGVEPLPLDAGMATQPAAPGVIQYDINGGNGVDMGGSNHQSQGQMMLPGNGENGHAQLPWHAYQPNTTTVSAFPGHGFQCTGNNYVDMDECSEMLMPSDANAAEYSEMLMPSNANAAAYGGWYDQASWGTDESPCDAIAGNPAYFMPPQHEQYHSIGIGGFMDAAGGQEHETGCLADYFQFQCPDASSQQFGAEPEQLHYLSDMAQGISYYDDLQLQAGGGGWCSGEAQIFAPSHSCSASGTPQFIGSDTSEQSQSDVGHQDQDPGVQPFWMMEGPPGSSLTDVATAGARARGGPYQTWISVYQ